MQIDFSGADLLFRSKRRRLLAVFLPLTGKVKVAISEGLLEFFM